MMNCFFNSRLENLMKESRKFLYKSVEADRKIPKNEPDNYTTETEVQVEETLSKLMPRYYVRPRH